MTEPTRQLAYLASLHNAAVVATVSWIAAVSIAANNHIMQASPASLGDLSALRFVGGGSAVVADQVPGYGSIAGSAVPGSGSGSGD